MAPRGDRESHRTLQGPDYVYPGYAYAPWTELVRLLASLARPLTTCFRATGGSEAVDLALQAAMVHTGRRAVLSLEGSYHGNTLAGLSIGASDNRERIKNLLPHCGKIGPTLDAKALRRIEQRLKRRDVAAFVICEHFDLDPPARTAVNKLTRAWSGPAAGFCDPPPLFSRRFIAGPAPKNSGPQCLSCAILPASVRRACRTSGLSLESETPRRRVAPHDGATR